MYNPLIKPPTSLSRGLSVFAITTFLGALLGGAYGFSIHKKEISDKLFTISQALAFGNKYVMVTLFTLSFITIIYLNYLRIPNNLLYWRISLLLVIYSLIITIIWITTYKNKEAHYISAGIIFSSIVLFIFTITFMYQRYLSKKDKYQTYILDINSMVAFACITLLVTFGIFTADDKSYLDEGIFASNENLMVLLTMTIIIYLGFI